MAGGHLDGCVRELRNAGEDAVLSDDGVAEEFPQFVDVFLGGNASTLQRVEQPSPVRLTAEYGELEYVIYSPFVAT